MPEREVDLAGVDRERELIERNARLMLDAVRAAGDGDLLRVVATATHVDHSGTRDGRDRDGTRHRGSVWYHADGRAGRVIEIADRVFLDDLRRYLDRAREATGHAPYDLERAFDWQV